MKRSLFMLGVAVAALSGCSQSEILEVAEGRAIGFSSFVNNNTRAVDEVTEGNLSQYYVFGNYGSDGASDWSGQAFNNELNTTLYYWQPGKIYRFGAYADGNGRKIASSGEGATVSFDATTPKLTFTNYTPDDAKDLVAAVTENQTANDHSNKKNDPVQLNFKHLLSQVKLTFTSTAAATYKLTISDVRIEGAVSTCTGDYTASGVTWNTDVSTTKNGYVYDFFKTEGKEISSEVSQYQSKLVIPQSGTEQLYVYFTATIKGEKPSGSADFTKNFKATLGHTAADGDSDNNKWQPSYCYNYIANVEIKDIVDNPDNLVEIKFEVKGVEEWKPVEAGTVTKKVNE
ncbi:uncharacterized protein BN612_00920 [Phocaeicola coprophilus CAG:333]|uniref:fimbrillin family protein n=1 Tax=Phocaeicola coprophilus TaxID=387090 RepID=UPI00034116BD|nr:fimbrillin family protein [Phocaeicola coprophilus]CDC58847.1 uncharacterized protein BN612_00920 [Phocaeicola coprophilus CAG:333]